MRQSFWQGCTIAATGLFALGAVSLGAVPDREEPAETAHQAGESFFERPGSIHPVSENASDTEPASMLAIFCTTF